MAKKHIEDLKLSRKIEDVRVKRWKD